MPFGNHIFARPLPAILSRLHARPELRRGLYHLRGDRFPNLPPEGLALVDLPTSRDYQHSEAGPYWYEPSEHAHKPQPPFSGELPHAPTHAELVFEPSDLSKRFGCIAHELPPKPLLEYCKGLSTELDTPVAWYTWLERGDSLYHDATWIFGRRSPKQLAPGITFTPAGGEDEEVTIFEGDSVQRGWLLWGNARIDSKHHDRMAIARLGLYFPVDGVARILEDFWRDFPWEDYLYLADANARMNRLRALVHTKPSPNGWSSICTLFDGWPVADDLEVGLLYASAHLESWPDKLRRAPRNWQKTRNSEGHEPRLTITALSKTQSPP